MEILAVCYNRFLELLIDENLSEKQEIEDQNKIINFLLKFIISKNDSQKVNSEKNQFLFYQITERNKILINFVDLKNKDEEQEAEDEEKSKPNEPKKRNFFGGFFSGSNKKQKPKQKKFDQIKFLKNFEEKENMFMEFHRTVYDMFIVKLIKIINRNENNKISSEIGKMTDLLNNTFPQEKLNRIMNEKGLDKIEKSKNNQKLDKWYFNMGNLSKIVSSFN